MINKKILIQGEKGDTGSAGTDITVPMSGIIAYKGDEIPTGYYSERRDTYLYGLAIGRSVSALYNITITGVRIYANQ